MDADKDNASDDTSPGIAVPSAFSGKYGVIVAEKKQFHPNEPLFLLRAADPLAPAAIISYAVRCQNEGCDHEHVEAAFAAAGRMRDWQAANPELVKKLPD